MIGGGSAQRGDRRAAAPFAVAAAGLALIGALVWPSAAQAVTIEVSHNDDAEIIYLDPASSYISGGGYRSLSTGLEQLAKALNSVSEN